MGNKLWDCMYLTAPVPDPLYASSLQVDQRSAVTGVVTLNGWIGPVLGVDGKIKAALDIGLNTVYIPKNEGQPYLESYPDNVKLVDGAVELIKSILDHDGQPAAGLAHAPTGFSGCATNMSFMRNAFSMVSTQRIELG